MSAPRPTAWRCLLCGYLHPETDPPESCPICGAHCDEFESVVEAPAPVTASTTTDRWRCVVCGYVHEGAEPPELCPVCAAERASFEPAPGPGRAGSTSSGRALRTVIVGAGIAGMSAAETVRKASPEAPILLIAMESERPYYRLNLTRYLAGDIHRDSLPMQPERWFEEQRIEWLGGAEVVRIDPAARAVRLADGRSIAYEALILAMGAHPFRPPVEGHLLDGVFTLRTAEDADAILQRLSGGGRCICIGGGILGIETAGALGRRGVETTLLESHDWLMPRQLNESAAQRLQRHIEHLGVEVRRRARTQALPGSGRVRGVRLEDGTELPADVVVFATGVRSNSALARRTGLGVGRGVLVDSFLATDHPGIYAAGDVAEFQGATYGAWGAAQYMGAIAAMNAIGIPTRFGGLPRSNTLKALGLDISSIGRFMPEDGGDRVIEDLSGDSYRRFLVREGRLVGAVLVGHSALAAPARQRIETQAVLPPALRQGAVAPDDLAQWLSAGS